MPLEQGRSWGHRPIWRWLALGVLILAVAVAAYRVYGSLGRTGEPCGHRRDCLSRICLEESGRNRSYCTEVCESDDQCPPTYRCLESPELANRLVCVQP